MCAVDHACCLQLVLVRFDFAFAVRNRFDVWNKKKAPNAHNKFKIDEISRLVGIETNEINCSPFNFVIQ